MADGAQSRDFIWVGDVVDVLLWLARHPHRFNGLFNLGTGQRPNLPGPRLTPSATPPVGLAATSSSSTSRPALHGQYQSYHPSPDGPAARRRLPHGPFTKLEDGINRYVRHYLASGALYR